MYTYKSMYILHVFNMFQLLLILMSVCACFGQFGIVEGPSNKTAEVGSTFTLTCRITGKEAKDSVFWKLYPYNSPEATPILLSLDSKSKNTSRYQLESESSYNLVVKSATYEDDGVFECDAGHDMKPARVYVYDKPTSMSLKWQGVEKGGELQANSEYTLQCESIQSHPPATHLFFIEGIELPSDGITYTIEQNSTTGYGNVTSYLPLKLHQEYINRKYTVRCQADLWIQQNVMSASFVINFATNSVKLSILWLTFSSCYWFYTYLQQF